MGMAGVPHGPIFLPFFTKFHSFKVVKCTGMNKRNRLLIRYFVFVFSGLSIHHKALVSYNSIDFSFVTSDSPPNERFFSDTNSKEWLYSKRLSNNADPQTAYNLILYGSPQKFAPLEITMCSNQSRFLGNRKGNASGGDDISDLSFRLLFLGIHHHQHQHASDEMKERHTHGINEMIYKETSRIRRNAPNITPPGVFDYECPNAKFLISAVPGGTGLGHGIRKVAVETINAAVATKRVALFVNAAPTGPRDLRDRWAMASCSRGDFQCFFMPLSPCTITKKDLETASVLSMEESRSWGKSKEVSDRYNSSRVVVMKAHTRQNPAWSWQARVEQVMDSITSYVQQARAVVNDKGTETIWYGNTDLALVKSYLERAEKKDPWIFDHALTFYILRPNPTSKHKIQDVMRRVFPSNFDPTSAIGVPIRSSDKCIRESECLSFDQYMRIARNLSLKKKTTKSRHMAEENIRNIVLTSESKEMLQARHRYNADENFPLTLIANDEDVAQGTGNPKEYNKMNSRNITADDIMLSTMTSLNMQLMAAHTVGNCCSNFHKLMLEFLSRGCGAAPRNIFECLQDNENPEYRLCCQWSANQECKNKRSFLGSVS